MQQAHTDTQYGASPTSSQTFTKLTGHAVLITDFIGDALHGLGKIDLLCS